MEKWKKLTDTVTYFIAKDSLPIYKYGLENVIFIIKSSYELRSMLLRGARKVSYSNVIERSSQSQLLQ